MHRIIYFVLCNAQTILIFFFKLFLKINWIFDSLERLTLVLLMTSAICSSNGILHLVKCLEY